MKHRRTDSEGSEPNIWPVVADVFISFLVIILIATLASYVDFRKKTGAGTSTPPPARDRFQKEFMSKFAGKAKALPKGFSELRLCFPAELLFNRCEVSLKDPSYLNDLKKMLPRSRAEIERVVVTGHTDSDPPSKDPKSRCVALGIRTNWQLSARRAIEVVEQIVKSPSNPDGIEPEKVWATARSSYEPASCDPSPELNPEKQKDRDRRIEVLLKFNEDEPVNQARQSPAMQHPE